MSLKQKTALYISLLSLAVSLVAFVGMVPTMVDQTREWRIKHVPWIATDADVQAYAQQKEMLQTVETLRENWSRIGAAQAPGAPANN